MAKANGHRPVESWAQPSPAAAKAARNGAERAAAIGGAAAAAAAGAQSSPGDPDASERSVPPQPPFRSLRGFAFDPSLSTALDTVGISTVLFNVPWEKLTPGPAGEYLQVVDFDPASGCYYEPVDLNHEHVLAQDGLSPSEGTPQFHQQMVYAVAMLTIHNFEHALGRRVLWRPGPSPDSSNPRDDSKFVGHLRIYPHALREPNAYYSPQKIALLFGYFAVEGDRCCDHLPGSQVFTCLSHDIIAHETTHALLDGMHRRFLVASNPDVRAFHEAFADMVALFQHFTFPEILRHQIATTRGEIRSQQSLLGALATQFGRATGKRGALRDAIGTIKDGKWVPHKPVPGEYETAKSPHERGAFLVAAVFDAFLSIYERRVADLLRLATRGTGILEAGAIHPDLVNRLADEAAKSAQHVLNMCVRALDYCPPTDITFGEFLQAVITADYDLVRDDDLNYRVAFIDAFRRRGIFPREVRTLSVESLLWRGPENSDKRPSTKLQEALELLRPFAARYMYTVDREEIFKLQRDMRLALHRWLQKHFRHPQFGKQDAEFLGIDRALPFEVHTARLALRTAPDGGVEPQLIVGLLQRSEIPVDEKDPAAGTMTFEGGCTIIGELRSRDICYCVRKRMGSEPRLQRQREFKATERDAPRAMYLSGLAHGGKGAGGNGAGDVDEDEGAEPFAIMHRGL
ncbi:MAG TPA: hypothetical protein VER17_05985 [Tepidisphaeraceae bacterium]|nr:hypothetical protein [Tepidisphaeraceae bacterium]